MAILEAYTICQSQIVNVLSQRKNDKILEYNFELLEDVSVKSVEWANWSTAQVLLRRHESLQLGNHFQRDKHKSIINILSHGL